MGSQCSRCAASKVGASEVDVPDDQLEDHLVSWPLKWPKGARRQS
jgi:hypothetical protein